MAASGATEQDFARSATRTETTAISGVSVERLPSRAAHHPFPAPKVAAERANNFNFLRLVLATLVIVGHSPELIDGDRHRELLTRLFHTLSLGDVAVDGFFILSGYLITQSWQHTPRLFAFLVKRMLRIYPGFLVAALLCAFVVGPLGTNIKPYFAHFQYARLCRDLLVLNEPATPPTFVGSPLPLVNGALWSIKSEFLCYLFVAVCGLGVLFKRRTLWPCLLAVALPLYVFPAFTMRAFHFLQLPTLNPYVVLSLARVFTFFLAGVCCYVLRDRIRFTRRGALLATALVLAGMFQPVTAGIVLCTAGAYLLLFCAFAPWPRLQRVGRKRDLSYGIYLYGWPLQKLLLWYFPALSPWTLSLFALVGAVGCGALSWTYVEKPCLNLKSRLPSASRHS